MVLFVDKWWKPTCQTDLTLNVGLTLCFIDSSLWVEVVYKHLQFLMLHGCAVTILSVIVTVVDVIFP